MNSMIEISFLIPAYNQSEELKECISSIIKYKGNEIEIVINDDCSSENLEVVIDSFNDNRIRLCHNQKNMGLDGNILNGIRNCYGRYIFLLRTKDFVIAESISDILAILKKYPNIVYLTGTSVDDDGLPNLFYNTEYNIKGTAALQMHDSVHFHPSGSLFKKDEIDTQKYEKYWRNFPESKIWFMVDQLIRLELTQKGDFYFSGRPIWIYTCTERSKNKSVHPNDKGHVYEQKYTFMRFQSEMEFVSNEFEENLKIERFIKAFEVWLDAATWLYLSIMSDEGMRRHYGIKKETVDIEIERVKFLEYAEKVERRLGIDDDRYFQEKEKAIQRNIEYAMQRQKIEKTQLAVREVSQPVIRQIEEMKLKGNELADYLVQRGFYKIGIYGIGYLGVIIWNELIHSNKIKIIFISDKMYQHKMDLGRGIWAIPPNEIDSYSVDVLLITPIQHKEVILKEVNVKAPMITISDLLQDNIEKY